MHASAEEMYSHVLVPSLYQVFLHAADYERLRPILDRVAADTKNALDAELARLNRVRLVDRLAARRSARYEPADRQWQVDLFPDADDEVAPGTVRVRSQLALPPRLDAGGGKTQFRVNVTRSRMDVPIDEAPTDGRWVMAIAQFTYNTGTSAEPKRVPMTRPEFTIGRGGPGRKVDLVIAQDSVSEIHARISRDANGAFYIHNLGRYGTALDGVDIPRGHKARLGLSARIELVGGSAVVEFRVMRSS